MEKILVGCNSTGINRFHVMIISAEFEIFY